MHNKSQVSTIILHEYGLHVKKMKRFPNGVMNENFLLTTDQGPFVLRVYRRKTESETRTERMMLRTLSRKGFPCPAPLTTGSGRDQIVVNNQIAILYPALPGRSIIRGTPTLLRAIGSLQGQLHRTRYGRTTESKHLNWDPEDLRKLVRQHRRDLQKSKSPLLRQLLPWLEHELAAFRFAKTLPRGMTHQDIKPENVLVRGLHVTGILDFDNAYRGVFLHDLTTTLMWWCIENGRMRQDCTRAFLQGYETQRILTKAECESFSEGLRFRLIREMLIGPITTLSHPAILERRLKYFWKVYQKMYP